MAGILTNGVRATQDLAYTTFNAALAEGMASVRDEDLWVREIAMEIPSNGEVELYDWLEATEDFSEWVGERRFQALRENAYALKNKDWAWGCEIKYPKFRDNKFLSQSMLFRQQGVNAKMHPQRKIAALLRGFATAGDECWDELPFFHAAHPVDFHDPSKGTFSNRITNSLTPANFAKARAAMMEFKDASGEILASPPDTMFVAPADAVTAEQIASSIVVPTVSGAGLNTGVALVARQKIRVVECPELSAEPGVWYLGRCRGPIKPMIFQRRSSPSVEWISDLNSEYRKVHNKVRLGADYSAAFGWTFPQLLVRCGDSSASTTL